MKLTPEERYDDMGNLLIADETRGVYLDCTYEEDISMASAQRRYYNTWKTIQNFGFHHNRLEHREHCSCCPTDVKRHDCSSGFVALFVDDVFDEGNYS